MNKVANYHLPKRSDALTVEVGRYSDVDLPPHASFRMKELRQYVKEFIAHMPDNSAAMIAFMGLPGVGKSSHTPRIQRAAEVALGFQEKDDLFYYKKPDGTVLEVGGHVCKKTSAILALLHADHFFRVFGEDRRGIMLKNISSCRRYWGNLGNGWKMIQDIFEGRPTDMRIYLGTPEEKEKKEGAGYVELNHAGYNKGKKVLIAEGVNTGEWHDRVKRIQGKTHVKTMKILFDMSIKDSMLRILRRDHDKKGYAFQEILEHRLREYYYILKLYLEPALGDPETVIFTKAREIPPFLIHERGEILSALEMVRMNVASSEQLPTEQKNFILKLINELQDHFSLYSGVNVLEMRLWKKQRNLKKYRKVSKRQRKHSCDGMSRLEITTKIKSLRNKIKKLKKRIVLSGTQRV